MALLFGITLMLPFVVTMGMFVFSQVRNIVTESDGNGLSDVGLLLASLILAFPAMMGLVLILYTYFA